MRGGASSRNADTSFKLSFGRARPGLPELPTLRVPMLILRMSLLMLLAAMACAAPGPSPLTTAARARPAMDSATIERLCMRPDRVRAGWAECLLKDQSPPPEMLLPPPMR